MGELDESQVAEALTWLRLQLEWESALRRLRRRAGLLPVTSGTAPTEPDFRAPAA